MTEETKAGEPVVWLFNGADGLWLNITCAGKHYSLNLSSDKMSHPVAVAIVNKFCNGKTGTGRIHVTDQETKAGDPVAWIDAQGFPHHKSHIQPVMTLKQGGWTPLYTAPPDTEALRQQNAELLRMLTEQGYEYNRNTNNLIERHTKQLAASLAEKLGLVELLARSADMLPACGLRDELHEALSTQPGDQSALREVIARVLEERGQAQRIGNADYGTDPYYLLIGNAAQLRSGEWTPEALK